MNNDFKKIRILFYAIVSILLCCSDYALSLNNKQIPDNALLYCDDFNDMDYQLVDKKLSKGLSWKLIDGSVINIKDSINGGGLGLCRNRSMIVAEQKIEALDFTVSFDCCVTWGSPVGLVLLYNDPDNYYQMNLTKGPITITRILNGKRTVIGSYRDSTITIPHSGQSLGSYKVHINCHENSIRFEIGCSGTGVDYDLIVTDSDPKAASLFKTGSFGFYELSSKDSKTSWYSIDNVKVFAGKLSEQRAAKVYYVDSGSSDGDGTKGRPFKYINQAAKLAFAGDTIIVKPGIYRESIQFVNHGGENCPITLKAFDPDNRPVIDGSKVLKSFSAPDKNKIYSTSFAGEVDSVYQDSKKMLIAMMPDAVDSEDPYNHTNWYEVKDSDIVKPGSSEEAAMVGNGFEYLILSDDFRTVQGKPVADDYWNGALLYHYNHNINTTSIRAVIDYDARLNRITVGLKENTKYSRISKPSRNRKDYYALANHIGLLDTPGEYVVSNGLINFRPFSDDLSPIEVSLLKEGVVLNKSNITMDGFEICHFKKHGIISSGNYPDNFKLYNSYIHHNGGSGLGLRNAFGITVKNCEFAYNNQNGMSFGANTGQIKLIDDYVHHNNNNGIWLGSGSALLYTCKDILIKGCKVVFQGSSQSHPDNIQFHQVCDLIMEDNFLQQQGHQNMWCQSSGRITIRNNIFRNGMIGLCQMSPAYIYNNVFDHSGLRFDAHMGTVGANIITKKDVYSKGWNNFYQEIAGDISKYPFNILWDESLDIVKQVRSYSKNKKALTEDLKDKIVARINEVINDYDFYKKHLYLYDRLSKENAAKHIVDAVIKRGIINDKGEITTSQKTLLKEEIVGLNRVILDEILLDGKVKKSVQNYRHHLVNIQNNVIIESSIAAPPKELYLTPYFTVNHNYYNIENSWLFSSWNKLAGLGRGSIISRNNATAANEFIDYDKGDFHLKPKSQLIDAGVDVALQYNDKAPDIGCYEF